MYEPVLALGTELTVLDGPVKASGYTWYKVAPVSFVGLEGPGYGWVALAGTDGEPWIVLATTDNATPFPDDVSLDANPARCPTSDEIALVDSIVTLRYQDDPTAPALVCRQQEGSADLTRFEERAYQAVLSMRRIQFDAPLPWTELSLFDWFGTVVNGITFRDTELSFCCDGSGVLVIRSRNMSHLETNLWLSRTDPAYGLLHFVQLLIHEARHAEGELEAPRRYLHTCAAGNDQTLEEMGSWALVYWFYVWLAEHAQNDYMTPVDAPADFYAAAARSLAEQTLSRFCTPPQL
jgi:hypothetical protein